MKSAIKPAIEKAKTLLNHRKNALSNTIRPSDANFFSLYTAALPQEQWESASLTNVFEAFRQFFITELGHGRLTGSLHNQINHEGDYRDIYLLLSMESRLVGGDLRLWRQFRTGSLDRRMLQLRRLLNDTGTVPLPFAYRQAYVERIGEDFRLMHLSRLLGTIRFTLEQEDAEYWQLMLDWDASIQQGTAVLKYEGLAREILQHSSSRMKESNVSEVMKRWKLNHSERLYLHLSDRHMVGTELPPQASVRWLEILLKRAGWEGRYRVRRRKNIPAIRVDPRAGQIDVPLHRKLSVDEMQFVGPHELWHLARVYHGSLQPCRLWQIGLSGYLSAEEGGASWVEMMYGRPLLHQRQKTLAARYLAVAMSLKVVWRGSVPKPLYTYEDIFETLCQSGIDMAEAAEIVWRVARGTSLTRQVAAKRFIYQGKRVNLLVAETYTKDRIYLEGQIHLLQELFGMTTFSVEEIDNLFHEGREVLAEWLQVLSLGKVPVTAVIPHSKWQNYIHWQTGFDMRKLHIPA